MNKKNCHKVIHSKGVPRIDTRLNINKTTDKKQLLKEKVQSLIGEKNEHKKNSCLFT